MNVSGYNKEFINKLISKYFNKKFKNKIVILYGFQGFPSNPKDLRLDLFDIFKRKRLIMDIRIIQNVDFQRIF